MEIVVGTCQRYLQYYKMKRRKFLCHMIRKNIQWTISSRLTIEMIEDDRIDELAVIFYRLLFIAGSIRNVHLEVLWWKTKPNPFLKVRVWAFVTSHCDSSQECFHPQVGSSTSTLDCNGSTSYTFHLLAVSTWPA